MRSDKKLRALSLFCLLIACNIFINKASGQNEAIADSIRIKYGIPELTYAVVSANSILEMTTIGIKRAKSDQKADKNDLFRIGSNTKTITGFLAALLVKEGKIAWDTRFFDLYPDWKTKSNEAYHSITLVQLLSFRTRLPRYTYTDLLPTKEDIKGSEEEQRSEFAKWCLMQKPVKIKDKDGLNFANPDFVLAALMLEKATGKNYKTLIGDLGNRLGIEFHFGQPNNIDSLQPWGHNADNEPEPPGDNYKLNWLLPAGNITLSMPEYAKFIQLQLRGLRGQSSLLSAKDYNYLHFGLKRFSIGWYSDIDENNNVFSWHLGNPGTFMSFAYVYKDQNRAIILLSNVQSPKAEEGMNELLAQLKKEYLPSKTK